MQGKDGHVRAWVVKKGSRALVRQAVEKLHCLVIILRLYLTRSLEAGECVGESNRKIGIGEGEMRLRHELVDVDCNIRRVE